MMTTTSWRSVLFYVGLAVTIVVPNVLILQKERVLKDGTTVLLELAPVDPRSLMQGDYMMLEYAITRRTLGGGFFVRGTPNSALADLEKWPRDGHLVIRLDEHGVGQLLRRHDAGTPLGPDERLLRYRVRGSRVRLGAESFFFQEGHGKRYEKARFGELRLTASGDSVLVGLRDAERQPMGSAEPAPPGPPN